MDSPYWKGPLPGVDVQRRLPVENVPGASRTAFRGQPKSVRLQPGIRVRLHPGMLFGISPESCSASPRNAVRLAPEYAGTPLAGISAADIAEHQVIRFRLLPTATGTDLALAPGAAVPEPSTVVLMGMSSFVVFLGWAIQGIRDRG